MSNNSLHKNSINRDDVLSNFDIFTSLHRAYLSMIGVVEHVKLQIRHFEEAKYRKCQFFENDDVTIQQHEVAHILDIED